MGKIYRIGTRTSPLALRQVEEVLGALRKFYPDFKSEIVGIETYGDRDKTTPISDIEGTDFFTREIDKMLLNGEIDLAVHSAKDLPDKILEGLSIAAITRSIDPYDALVSKGNLKIDELRIGARIGASSLRRKRQLKRYRKDFQIIDIRGNIEEKLTKLDKPSPCSQGLGKGGLDAIIVAACALMRLGLEERITQRIPFEILRPHPLQGSLAVVARKKDLKLTELLSIVDSPRPLRAEAGLEGDYFNMSGKVYLVGAGPGKPDLITVRGLNILRQADVVIYDYLVDKGLLDEAKEDAELICCDKLGKNRYSDGFLIHQERINNLIVKKAKEAKKVVRLKNGDPAIFSRLSQELDVLAKNKIEFEIIPGVTAASAAASFSGIPLTDRRFASSCVFVTGHEDPTKKESSLNWQSLANDGTIVLYMAVENLHKIVRELINMGKSPVTPVAVIQDASLFTQKVLTGTLKDIVVKVKKEKIRPPCIIIIGEVVRLEKDFSWLRKTKRILFTGISKERFFEKGFVFHLPLIKILPLKDYTEFDRALKNIGDYDWIIFASRYGVEYFFKRLKAVGLDARALNGIKIAAIGGSTKNRLLDFGILADLVPKKESSNGLIEEFRRIDIKNKKIFLPRSDISDKGLENELIKLGSKVTSSFAYRNVMPRDLPDLDLNDFDEIIFSSPSTVRNFKKRYKRVPEKVKISSIGDVTLREIKRCRLRG